MSSSDKSWKNRLRRTRPEDFVRLEAALEAEKRKAEANIEAEKRRAEDQAAKADALYHSAKEIEVVVYGLAEKWRPIELKFWEDIDYLCRKYANDPDILSVKLVESLVKDFEHHWTMSKLSERWDSDLWNELHELVTKFHTDPPRKMQRYKEEMSIERERGLKKMKEFVQRVDTQYKSIKQLEAEVTKLEKETQDAGLKQVHAIEQLKQEHEDAVVQIILGAQEKLKEELAEQAKLRKDALLEAQQIASEEKRIIHEEYDKSKKDAQYHSEMEKLNLQSTLQEKFDQEKKEMRETHNKSINSHINHTTLLQEKLDDATKNVQQKVDKIKQELEDEIDRLKKDLESKKTAFNEHLVSVAKNHQDELENITEKHEMEKKELRISLHREIQELKFEISELKESHTEQIRLIEQRNTMARNALEESHRLTVGEMQREFGHATTKLKEKHSDKEKVLETRITQLLKDHRNENATLRTRITEMETEHAHEKDEMSSIWEQEKTELERQVTSELARLRADFKAKKSQLDASHSEATSQLRNDVEAYSQALLARDDFKPMPDNEIKSKFEDLAEEVKTLGRLEWREEQTIWPAQVLKRLSTNITLFKRRVLQEMIWVILHKHIFCSPFRAFGEEGEIMERKWSDAYGADPRFENGCYTWPQPEMEAERWRYVNVKECRTALRQPIDSEWDPRAKLKVGFRTTLDDIRTEFTSAIGELVHLEKANVQLMDKISKKAANVWLEYGMQRCRIVVLFGASSLKPPAERIRKTRDGSFELMVVPELRRFGNSKGLELHTEATVAGCGGETVEISSRKS